MKIRYFAVPAGLDRYFAAVFHAEIALDGSERVEDILFPEWATLRFQQGCGTTAWLRTGHRVEHCRFSVTGPRSQEAHFSIGPVRQWGFRLTPLGWAAYVGLPADRYADVVLDGDADEGFARFRPLHAILAAHEGDSESQHGALCAFLAGLERLPVPHEALICAVSSALRNEEVRTVAGLVEQVDAHPRTLERICRSSFGFPPMVLLRRQRFLRSLEQFTLDPTLRWIGALDSGYHDQAQFVRDFRKFMGMTPGDYARLAKPVLGPLIREKARYARHGVGGGPLRG